jgi:hypothetical protein
MAIATVKQVCTPNAVVTSDSLVEQVAQLDDFASGNIDGREFFRRNHFTSGLELLLKREFERLAGKTDDGAFYLTQAMGGGKTHSLIAFGLLAANPELRKEILPHLPSTRDFDAAKVVIFNGHQSPESLLWGYIADQLAHSRGRRHSPELHDRIWTDSETFAPDSDNAAPDFQLRDGVDALYSAASRCHSVVVVKSATSREDVRHADYHNWD